MRLMSLLISCQSIQNQPRSLFSSRGLVLNHLSVQIPSTVLIYYYCTAQYHSMNCLSVQFQSLLLVLNSLFTLSLPTQVTLSIRCGLADLQKKQTKASSSLILNSSRTSVVYRIQTLVQQQSQCK